MAEKERSEAAESNKQEKPLMGFSWNLFLSERRCLAALPKKLPSVAGAFFMAEKEKDPIARETPDGFPLGPFPFRVRKLDPLKDAPTNVGGLFFGGERAQRSDISVITKTPSGTEVFYFCTFFA